MNGSGIDTSAMLTMLGLVAAVWALIPETARLSFRLSLSWWDWLVIWGAMLAIHGLYLEPDLVALHAAPNLGPWRWGFDKGATQYLLFLGLAGYVYARVRRTRLNRWKLPLFERLATSLLHTRRFEDLAQLLDDHIEAAIRFVRLTGIRARVEAWLRPAKPDLTWIRQEDGLIAFAPRRPTSWPTRIWSTMREHGADVLAPAQVPQQHARMVLKVVLSSRDMVAYLALSRPYLCIRIMEPVQSIVEEFQDEFFNALLGDEASILFSEIKNSQNLAGAQGRRALIPDENRLLGFYLKDISVGARLSVYQSIGEAVLARIDSDDALIARLNGPLLTYQEAGRHRCPVHVGISFFRIMVLEGLHQRSDDHLWLHYFPHFARRLVARARPLRPDDANHEFATPLGYLLYELVAGTMAWIDDAIHLCRARDVVVEDAPEGEHVHISFEATRALPGVLEPILCSDRVTPRLKTELLGVVLNTLVRVEQRPQLAGLASALINGLVRPYEGAPSREYALELRTYFQSQDHRLRAQTPRFEQALEEARIGR